MKKLQNLDLTIRSAELAGPKFRALAAKLHARRESRNVTASQGAKLAVAERKSAEIDTLCQQLVKLALRLRLKRSLARAAAQERALARVPVTDADRRAQAKRVAAKIQADNEREYQRQVEAVFTRDFFRGTRLLNIVFKNSIQHFIRRERVGVLLVGTQFG